MVDLKNIEELRRACSDVVENAPTDSVYVKWGKDLPEFLAEIRAADFQMRVSKQFQRLIWRDNPVASTGRGYISVDKAIADPEFRKWLAERSMERLPEAPEPRKVALDRLYNELKETVCQYTKSTPRLMIYRVLAGFFPSDFTTLANIKRTRRLHAAMFGNRGGAGPSCHANILKKLDEVRGSIPAEDDIDAIVDRMRLPWLLDEYYVAPRDDEGKEPTGESRNDARLVPLPAARRRKGLTTVTGGYQTLLNILDYCRDGTTREDLTSFVNTEHPRLTERSIRTQINGIANELNCLKLDGNRVVLTEQGRALVESEDPGELMDWLVTRILGVDHAMVILRAEKRCTPQELARRIQEVNPGWTTTRTPSVIISRLRELDMLDIDEHHVLSLTNAGKKCAQRIHWQPEALAPLPGKTDDVAMPPVVPEPVSMRLPEFADIKLKISKGGHFPATVIRKLHYGLWANERRHFAILTGLSGSGKTLLARSYGKAIGGRVRRKQPSSEYRTGAARMVRSVRAARICEPATGELLYSYTVS